MKTKIISRHEGAISWLESKGIRGEVIPHLDMDSVHAGDRIYGILPVPLIAEALEKGAEVNVLVLPSIAFGDRGKELTPAEMDEAGAKILRVENLTLREVGK